MCVDDAVEVEVGERLSVSSGRRESVTVRDVVIDAVRVSTCVGESRFRVKDFVCVMVSVMVSVPVSHFVTGETDFVGERVMVTSHDSDSDTEPENISEALDVASTDTVTRLRLRDAVCSSDTDALPVGEAVSLTVGLLGNDGEAVVVGDADRRLSVGSAESVRLGESVSVGDIDTEADRAIVADVVGVGVVLAETVTLRA